MKVVEIGALNDKCDGCGNIGDKNKRMPLVYYYKSGHKYHDSENCTKQKPLSMKLL